jgi:UDP-N-acetyl-D-galactosamine dehydrogenase
VNVLGLTFKEDVPDLRNSRVIDVINELRSYGVEVHVHDPVPLPQDAQHEYGIELRSWDALPQAEAMVVAVAHRRFRALDATELATKVVPGGCFIDVKAAFDTASLRAAGLCVWRL